MRKLGSRESNGLTQKSYNWLMENWDQNEDFLFQITIPPCLSILEWDVFCGAYTI